MKGSPLWVAVNAIVRRWDPMNLLAVTGQESEWDGEVAELTARLKHGELFTAKSMQQFWEYWFYKDCLTSSPD